MNTTRAFSSGFCKFCGLTACGVFVCLIESTRGEQGFIFVVRGYIYLYIV